jgi:hypothetical protein
MSIAEAGRAKTRKISSTTALTGILQTQDTAFYKKGKEKSLFFQNFFVLTKAKFTVAQ